MRIGDHLPAFEEVEAAISVASITELHFGVLVADDDDERARHTARLAVVEATFDPLPVNVEVALVWGQLAAAMTRHGGNLRRHQIDLAIAAAAHVEGVPLITENIGHFQIIDDMVEVRRPSNR